MVDIILLYMTEAKKGIDYIYYQIITNYLYKG